MSRSEPKFQMYASSLCLCSIHIWKRVILQRKLWRYFPLPNSFHLSRFAFEFTVNGCISYYCFGIPTFNSVCWRSKSQCVSFPFRYVLMNARPLHGPSLEEWEDKTRLSELERQSVFELQDSCTELPLPPEVRTLEHVPPLRAQLVLTPGIL